MKKRINTLGLMLIILQVFLYSQVSITNLKCEYLNNPLGIDESHPRFTWQIESSIPDYSQMAYEIAMGTSEADIITGRGDTWNSGVVKSSTVPAIYKEDNLKPFTRFYWSVRIQDKNGQWSSWSVPAFFETGMMKQSNWRGKWITDTYDYNVKSASFFRKVFKSEKKSSLLGLIL